MMKTCIVAWVYARHITPFITKKLFGTKLYTIVQNARSFSFKEILVMFQAFSDMKPRLTVYVYHFYSLVDATDCISEGLNLWKWKTFYVQCTCFRNLKVLEVLNLDWADSAKFLRCSTFPKFLKPCQF